MNNKTMGLTYIEENRSTRQGRAINADETETPKNKSGLTRRGE